MKPASSQKIQEGEQKLASNGDQLNQAVLSLLHPPFWDELASCHSVLLAGCGGGYDFMAGLPLLFALERCGIQVHLSNVTFTNTEDLSSELVTPTMRCVKADDKRKGSGWLVEEDYWPELLVSRWFRQERQQERCVYMMDRSGVKPMQACYSYLCKHLQLDAIILVDGGTDSLMFGPESGLGTPEEDMCSIAAVSGLSAHTVKTFLLAIGFGIDCYHGVSHHDFLNNVATLQRCTPSGYLGSFSLHGQLHEEARLSKACFMACDPGNSIVNSCMTAAAEGAFGDSHPQATAGRTRGSELYLSPLMAQYWAFRLDTLAAHVVYLNTEFRQTETYDQIRRHIKKYRRSIKPLPVKSIPY